MKKNTFSKLSMAVLSLMIIITLAGCEKKQEPVSISSTKPSKNLSENKKTTNTAEFGTISLAADKTNILSDDEVFLGIDDENIFNWFRTQSQLCNESNLKSTPDRKSFCEDKEVFKKMTRFKSIVVSPDNRTIGFTIESDTLTPDTVTGVIQRSDKSLRILTNYYLGNEFLSFSPKGNSFVFRSNCWEGMCGLSILDSKSMKEKISINNPKSVDMRITDAKFLRWISDNEVEHLLGNELKQESF